VTKTDKALLVGRLPSGKWPSSGQVRGNPRNKDTEVSLSARGGNIKQNDRNGPTAKGRIEGGGERHERRELVRGRCSKVAASFTEWAVTETRELTKGLSGLV